jgi:hypothetical protein
MRRLLSPCLLLLVPAVAAAGFADCDEHRERVASIMDARLAGERREALAADLAGGGPPSSRLIRLITDVYELPQADLRGGARETRLDEYYERCLAD